MLGVDRDAATIEYARSRYAGGNVEFAVMDIARLALQDASFDAVCAFEALEHVPDREAVLGELARVLRPEGTLVASTPRAERTTERPENPFHEVEYAPQDFERLLRTFFDRVELYGQRRLQTRRHRLLQRVDVLGLRKRVMRPPRVAAAVLGTAATPDVTLDDVVIEPARCAGGGDRRRLHRPAPVRVVHLVIGGEVAGGQLVALRLARAARERGWEASFVSPTPGAFVDLAGREGFPVRVVPLGGALHLGSLARLRNLLRREGADVLHTHVHFSLNTLGRVAGHYGGVRVVSHMHIANVFREGGYARRAQIGLDNRTARLCDAIVAVSEATRRELLEQGYPAERTIVVRNGVDPAPRVEPRRPDDVPEGAPVLLEVARLTPVKGQRELIEALARLERRDAVVVLAGKDLERGGAYERELERLAERLGVRERVVLAGYRDDVPELLAGCDVFVLPSHAEGLPLTVLEAMAAAKPVVASAVDGTPEVVAGARRACSCRPATSRLSLRHSTGCSPSPSSRDGWARRGDGGSRNGSPRRRRASACSPRTPHDAALPAHRDPGAVPDPALQRARRAARPARLVPARRPAGAGLPPARGRDALPLAGAPGVRLGAGVRWVLLNRGVLGALRGADVVLVGGWSQPAFWEALAVDRVRRVPTVAWVESTLRDERSGLGAGAKRLFARNTAAFIVPGTAAAEYVRSFAPDAEVVVAPNAVDTGLFASRTGERERLRGELGLDRPAVLYVGRLSREKGVDVLVEAARGLEADVVVVGRRPGGGEPARGGAHERPLRRPSRPGRADGLVRGRRRALPALALRHLGHDPERGRRRGPAARRVRGGRGRWDLVEDGVNGFRVRTGDGPPARRASTSRRGRVVAPLGWSTLARLSGRLHRRGLGRGGRCTRG